MLNQVMETHAAEVRAYEDLEGELQDVIEMLRRRVPHGDILDFLKIKDSEEIQFRKNYGEERSPKKAELVVHLV